MNTKLKICGITRREDVAFAVEAGADFLGFIFHEPSPRHTNVKNVKLITRGLPEKIKKVGIFVNQSLTEIQQIACMCDLDIIQLHGPYTAEDAIAIGQEKVWKAFNFNDPKAVEQSRDFPAAVIVADAMTREKHGGTGIDCNWQDAAEIARLRPLVLAGGLSPANALEAALAVEPYAIDLNSGIEQAPGIKDLKLIAKMAEIMKQIKGL
ncbi:MAG: phosphoribosylanthranilate isomerase [Lentisphaerae bacterium]|nr:phosphoribosylanthranilate isomerase [Lentisphaerota bacterium]MCP4103568.1 phosphoribosylanthranilate isomerase [Lentisphaerota bacterium]